MARNDTFQYRTTMSINREKFTNIVVCNDNLSKKDLRVLLHLMTHLDALSYREISKKNIADTLNISKADVNKAIDNLLIEEVIDRGNSPTVKNGYKLLF